MSMSGIRECPQEPLNGAEFVLFMALAQSPQTFSDLWPAANRALGHDSANHCAPGYRFTDRWQKGRKSGRLRMTRTGGRPHWALTAAGHAEFVRTLADATQNPPQERDRT